MQPSIHVIHDNHDWNYPLQKRMEQRKLPYQLWYLDEGCFALNSEPPPGVYLSRISASSHTRGHRFAPEYAEAILVWLERHGRTVINGSSALRLEISKVNQYMALNRAGIATPETMVATGKNQIVQAARQLGRNSFIIKHNRAGKGQGVRAFHSIDDLQKHVDGPEFQEPVDGITLIQQHIISPTPHIVRYEFIGGRFFYGVKVDTSGGFQLCPADGCNYTDGSDSVSTRSQGARFEIVKEHHSGFINQLESFLTLNQVQVAGIECITDTDGNRYIYDVNVNTNYNPEAEAVAGSFGMLELAGYLERKLASLH